MASSFPILSIDEVIEKCKVLFNLNISEEDLRQPTSQFVKEFYLQVVTAMLNISPEQMTQPSFNLTQKFEHWPLIEQGASLQFFVILLQRFMHSCMITNFSQADIINPKPKRTLNCISAIINFQIFNTNQHNVYEAAVTEMDAVKDQKRLLLEKNKELKEKIAQIKATRTKEEAKAQQILSEVDNLEGVVHDLNRQQAASLKEIQQLKTEIAERTSKEAQIRVTIVNDQEECERLKAQIVSSPDKFPGETERLTKIINSCKISIAEKTEKLQGLKTQVESINVLEEGSRQSVKLIASVEEETEKLRVLQKKVQDMRDIGTTDDEILRELMAKLQNMKLQFSSLNDKVVRLETKNQKRISSKNTAIERSKKDYEILKNASAPDEVGLKEVLQTLEEKESFHRKRMDEMQSAYKELLNALETYHKSLEKGWQELAASLADE